jgi:hypothetical protein
MDLGFQYFKFWWGCGIFGGLWNLPVYSVNAIVSVELWLICILV